MSCCLLLTVLSFSCNTTKIATGTSHSYTEHSAEVSKTIDSVYFHKTDSIFVKIANDTVFIEKYKTVYHYKLKNDTIRLTDTIVSIKEQSVSKTEYVEKQLNWWQKWQINGFWFLLVNKWLIGWLLYKNPKRTEEFRGLRGIKGVITDKGGRDEYHVVHSPNSLTAYKYNTDAKIAPGEPPSQRSE